MYNAQREGGEGGDGCKADDVPIVLPPLELERDYPSRPSAVVWLALLVLCLLAGVLSTLLTWPGGVPTGGAWFWMRLLGFPTLAWCLVFGLRLHFYDEERNRFDADKQALQSDRREAIEFGSEPLAVLGFSYQTALGSKDVATAITGKSSALVARRPTPDMPAIRHTKLVLDGKRGPRRFRLAFHQLITSLKPVLRALPTDVPLSVHLQLPPNVNRNRLCEVWRLCWQEQGHRHVKPTLLSVEDGLMALEAWLDVTGGASLEKFALFVSVQLHEAPSEGSAEVAVAFLLGWAPLVERRSLPILALLHRPVSSQPAAPVEALRIALLWGQASPPEVKNLWQSGLSIADKTALSVDIADLAPNVAQQADASGLKDIDAALGNPGVAAAWLALALATESAARVQEMQLVAGREAALRFAVIQPPRVRIEQD